MSDDSEDARRRGDLPEELLSTEPMILSSRDDLTLADVDAFFSAMADAKGGVDAPRRILSTTRDRAVSEGGAPRATAATAGA